MHDFTKRRDSGGTDMRMSTRGRFGLRALLALAKRGNNTPISVAALAEEMDVSADYLMQLFVKLRQAGLITSVRGPRGGFRLARPAGQITVADIVTAVEGPIAVTHCVDMSPSAKSKKKNKPPCPKQPTCLARIVWEELTGEIADLLQNTTLARVLEEGRRRGLPVEAKTATRA